MEGAEGALSYPGHKDHIGWPGLKEDNQSYKSDTEDHVDQPAKAGVDLGDILNLETRINGSNTYSHAHNGDGNKEDGYRGDDHHKWGNMEECVGEDDQDLCKKEKRDK